MAGIFLGVVILAVGCTSTPEQPAASPKVTRPEGLERARQAFAAARYDEAQSAYEGFLEGRGDTTRMEALYHLALIELVRDPKARSFSKARTQLGEVKVKSSYKKTEVQAMLELLVNLEETRASLRRRSETLRDQQEKLEAQDESIRQKEEALKNVTDTIIGGDTE